MSSEPIQRPERNTGLSKAYLELAKAKANKDLAAIASAEEVIRTAKT